MTPLLAKKHLLIPKMKIASFCRRWHIKSIALFGSVLRSDFREKSDIDVLVSFRAGAHTGLLEHVQMERELEGILGKKVDLISKKALQKNRNWLIRKEILKTAQIIYAS